MELLILICFTFQVSFINIPLGWFQAIFLTSFFPPLEELVDILYTRLDTQLIKPTNQKSCYAKEEENAYIKRWLLVL